jgi:hypothetical protein
MGKNRPPGRPETDEVSRVPGAAAARILSDSVLLANVESVIGEGMSPLPPEIIESYLVRNTQDRALFRLSR